MKIYFNHILNNTKNYTKQSFHTNTLQQGESRDENKFVMNNYNDHQVIFKAKQTITATIENNKTKLLKNINGILKNNAPKLSDEEKAFILMRKAVAFAKSTAKRVEELYFQAETISQNKFLTPKQRLDSINEIDKEIKRLEKLKMPKEEPAKPIDERIDYALINLFKSALLKNDFDLKQVFLNYYSDLKNITSIKELNEKYPQIKTPPHPIDVMAKRSTEVLDRGFYQGLHKLFTNTSDVKEITTYISERTLPIINNIIMRTHQDSYEFQQHFVDSFIRNILDVYENVVLKSGFGFIPIERNQTEIPISNIEIALLHIDYDDFVLNTLRKQYLEGKKVNELEYQNDTVQFTLNELKNSEYKFEKLSEKTKKIISDSEKIKLLQRDYKNCTPEELRNRLNYYSNTSYGLIDTIFDTIVAFDGCKDTPEDLRYMVKFLKELDNISDLNLTKTDAEKIIQEKDLRPHGTDKINQAELLKVQAERKNLQQQSYQLNSLQDNFDNAISALYQRNMATTAEICSKYYPEKFDKKAFENANKIIKLINTGILNQRNAQQIEAEVLQWETYNEAIKNSQDSEIFNLAKKYSETFSEEEKESKIGQYLWNSEFISNYPKNKEFYLNPEILDIIMEKFKENKDIATILLCKYEDYMLLSSKDKTSILKILEIFDYKNQNNKIILKYIIENDYSTKDTSVTPAEISNQIKTDQRVFASSAKQQILDKYKYPQCIDFLKAFEEALALDAKAQGSSGVKKTGRNNDSLIYRIETKLAGHNDRLFSSKNNYYFDIFSETGLH